MLRWLGMFLFLLLDSAAGIAMPALAIDADFRSAPLRVCAEVASDNSAQWSLQDAMHQSFTPLPAKSFGFTRSAIWLRGRISNRDTSDRLLVLDTADRVFTLVTFYVLQAGSAQPIGSATYGSLRPFSQRALKSRTIAFPFIIRSGQTYDIYLRIEGVSELRIAPQLYSDAEFQQRQYEDTVDVYFFYGAMTALLVVNLFLALGFRDTTSFSCVALVLAWTALGAVSVGVLYQWWPQALGPFRVRYIYVPVPFVLILLALFTRHYLELAKYGRRFVQLQYVIMGCGAVYIPAIIFFPMQPLRNVTVGVFTVVLLSELIAAYLLTRRGSYYARNYLFAYVIMYISLLGALCAFYLPGYHYQTMSFASQWSPFLLLLVFTFGVVDRINRLKLEARQGQQNALLARAEAEFKNRFLVTMSHEIRTPLNGVVGMIDLLQGTPLTDTQQRYTDVINASGRALMDVINNVLDFAKLEHGKVSLELLGINLEQLVDECIDVFAITKKSGSVVFNACIEPGTPLLIKGDPTRLKQVLINLVANALKFTEVGEVNLRIYVVGGKDYSKATPMLKFAITDTGVGMDNMARQQLFAAFSQADSSIARKYGGTGLGLAICKQLVDLMGGSVGVESQVGIGSTFWFTLPLLLANADEVVDLVELAPTLYGKRALVVDDHDAFCHSMQVALESFGMHVTIAQTAQAARTEMTLAHYDVLMIDRCLPDQEGLELARSIHNDFGAATPPMLLVSLALDILDDSALAAIGIVAHLIKPISLHSLRQRLVHLFGAAASSPLLPAVAAIADAGPMNRCVLVAEDNKVNQIVLGGLLNKLGVQVVFADDGQQAVDCYLESMRVGARAFDVIIMDYDMPVLDGVGATAQIREYEMRQGLDNIIRIIGLTAYSANEYRDRGLAAGMNSVLTKPVSLNQLKQIFTMDAMIQPTLV